MGRLRPADRVVFLSAVLAAMSLAVDWFHVPPGRLPRGWTGYAPISPGASGWSSLGWAAVALILVTIATALLLVAQLARGARDALNVPPGVFLAALAPPTLIVTVVVTLSHVSGPTRLDDGGRLGLAALATLTIAAWRSLKDERTDQRSRQVVPPPARPAPPAS